MAAPTRRVCGGMKEAAFFSTVTVIQNTVTVCSSPMRELLSRGDLVGIADTNGILERISHEVWLVLSVVYLQPDDCHFPEVLFSTENNF